MKKGILFLEIALVVSVLAFFYLYRDSRIKSDRQDTLEAIAIEATSAIYDGRLDYFMVAATEDIQETIQTTMVQLRGREIVQLTVQNYLDDVRSSGEVVVVTRAYEQPFDRIIQHRFVFVEMEGRWKIITFEPSTG